MSRRRSPTSTSLRTSGALDGIQISLDPVEGKLKRPYGLGEAMSTAVQCRLTRDLSGELCASSRRALDVETTAERLDAIRETDEPGPRGRLRASDSVVAHDDRREPVRALDRNAGVCRLRVLRDVRDRLRDQVVDRRLDGVRQPVVRNTSELDRDRRALGERADCTLETSLGENGRVNPARELPQLSERVIELVARFRKQRLRGLRVVPQARLDQPELERQ